MDKLGETIALEEVTTKEAKFKVTLFLIRADEYKYGQVFEDLRGNLF